MLVLRAASPFALALTGALALAASVYAAAPDDPFEAAGGGSASEARAALSAGARDERGSTLPHAAAEMNPGASVIAALIEDGSDAGARGENGATPLHWAAMMNPNPAVIAALIAGGADPAARDERGKTPFDYAKDNAALRGTDAYWRLHDARFE